MDCHDNSADLTKQDKKLTSFAFIIAASICLLACISLTLFQSVKYTQNQNPLKIKSKINPNNASKASLMRLSGIGLIKAADIVEYRKHCEKQKKAFKNVDDLQQVYGIGPKTVEKVKNFIEIE